MANGPFSPLFQPGGPFGQIAPGISPMVNPATMLGFGLHQQQPVQAMLGLGQMQQTAQAQQQQQQQIEMRRMQMALEAQERARRLEAQRKAAEGLQAISGGIFSILAADLQTDANRRAIEGLGTLPGGPELLTQVWARQVGLSEPGEQFVPLTPEQVRERGLDSEKAYQMSTKTGKVSQIGSSPLVQVMGERSPVAKLQADIRDAIARGDLQAAEELQLRVETEGVRKQRVAAEEFGRAFQLFDEARKKLAENPLDLNAHAAFTQAQRNFAEGLAAKRAGTRAPTDDDRRAALDETPGKGDIVRGTFDTRMNQIAQSFEFERAPPVADLPTNDQGLPIVETKEQRDALPVGTRYIAPDGSERIR